MNVWPSDLSGLVFYFVGIKGTGMTALAELLLNQGAFVSGSDVEDIFYTDAILASLGIKVYQGFAESNLPESIDVVVHSSAYDPQAHPELVKARARNLPVMEYTKALGAFSASTDSSGVSGVHGKTSTTAMAGTMVKHLGLGGSVLVGSGVANFDGRSTWSKGREFFIAETCEYRRHFLDFSPRRMIMTSLEPDHLDYFKDLDDMARAFVEYAQRLPQGGAYIYCVDDSGAADVANQVAKLRADLKMIPYGFTASGAYRIFDHEISRERQTFKLGGYPGHVFSLQVPGEHNVRNATAAFALVCDIYTDHYCTPEAAVVAKLVEGLASFRGTKRRSEILGETHGVLFMDDYAHHPTAIRSTLAGYKAFYPRRRLVLDFMSHTYSRTQALLDDFAAAFSSADLLILHEIYASAREKNTGGVSGEQLFEKTRAQHPDVRYIARIDDAHEAIAEILQPGDLFVTMGAGDNWKVGERLYRSWLAESAAALKGGRS